MLHYQYSNHININGAFTNIPYTVDYFTKRVALSKENVSNFCTLKMLFEVLITLKKRGVSEDAFLRSCVFV